MLVRNVEIWVALAGVAVGAAGVLIQQQAQSSSENRRRSEEVARLVRLEDRLELTIQAGKEIQADLHAVADKLRCLELQVSKLAGYMGQMRRSTD